jgi:tRNA1(Val) A37 N6-methylase TrmN6
MWATKAKECTSFKPTLAYAFFKMYNAKRILDFSAGWGDRLIASIASNVERYTAFDPNADLKNGHDEMIKMFVPKQDRKNYKITYEPFEKATLDPKQTFDMVFTSPPYFDLEEYSKDKTQSISSFKTVNEWTNGFLIPAIQKAWDVLEENGHMVLHIADYKDKRYVEAMNLYIQWKCEKSLFLGIVGSIGMQGQPKPLWVWKKINTTNVERSKQAENYLKKLFPYVYSKWN